MTAQLLAGITWPFAITGIPLLDAAISILAVCVVLAVFMSVYAGVATYVERKVASHIQHRVGPHRVGFHGILQWVADSLKLLMKEDIVPAKTDKLLFRLAPYIVFASALAVWAALPFARGWCPASFNIGILYILAIGGVGVIGILMAGWSSGNKWSLFGAMRGAAQIVSYEVPTGLTVLTILLVVGSLEMQTIGESQATGLFGFATQDSYGIFSWHLFRFFPFGFIAFIVFYMAILAETNRTPFDIPEADSELVAGFHTEYSGMRFAFFFLAEYCNMFAASAVAVTLFLGAWLPPWSGMDGGVLGLVLGILIGAVCLAVKRHLIYGLGGFLVGGGIGITVGAFFPIWADQAAFLGHTDLLGSQTLVFLEGMFWFVSKTLFLIFVMMWLRWTLPRYRVDQLMDLCWKKLTPIAFANLVVIGSLELLIRGS
ncbi:MAG: complex I subunit 1/NuoH family protein [Planctomycetota bacterium]|jgi:NADH-quinone oxidoreductase subunit H